MMKGIIAGVLILSAFAGCGAHKDAHVSGETVRHESRVVRNSPVRHIESQDRSMVNDTMAQDEIIFTPPTRSTRSVRNTGNAQVDNTHAVDAASQADLQARMDIDMDTRAVVPVVATEKSDVSQKSQLSAEHKTEFNSKEKNRANNIKRASDAIDGHIVQPGEVFSYNETVGPTIERRGYKKGIIFVDGKKSEGVGGGVCQVSTTLYNAVDELDLEIIERHDHSRPVTYAKKGDEAATSFGVIDFKFKNNKEYPLVINSSVNGGTISVKISAM